MGFVTAVKVAEVAKGTLTQTQYVSAKVIAKVTEVPKAATPPPTITPRNQNATAPNVTTTAYAVNRGFSYEGPRSAARGHDARGHSTTSSTTGNTRRLPNHRSKSDATTTCKTNPFTTPYAKTISHTTGFTFNGALRWQRLILRAAELLVRRLPPQSRMSHRRLKVLLHPWLCLRERFRLTSLSRGKGRRGHPRCQRSS